MDRWGEDLFRDAYAFIPQSTVADKVNEQGIEYVYYTDGFEKLELLNQVYDSLWFQIPISIGWAEHSRMLTSLKTSLETPIQWKGTEFVIPVELKMGLNLGETEEINLNGNVAQQLEEVYDGLR